jgi:hypothetical protein
MSKLSREHKAFLKSLRRSLDKPVREDCPRYTLLPYIPSNASFGSRPCAWRRGTTCSCQYCDGCPGEVPCAPRGHPCATCRGCPGCPEDCDLCMEAIA